MFIVNRYFKEKGGNHQHSSQYFDIPIPTDGNIPQDVKNRMYAICDADGNNPNVDYALCQTIDETGRVWRTELIKPLPQTV